MIKFLQDFLWGAATSAYQVEGNNQNCDWWEWEKKAGLKQVSGLACRHYEFYKQDFDLAKGLNHNSHRLSIEWSRIEPQDGKFSLKEIEHYQDVILALKERNIEPIVTLHHFTNPLWFANLGGWHNKNAYKYFLRYVQKIVDALCGNVRFWITINEPMVYVYHSYILGNWPPQEKSFFKANTVSENFIFSHIRAYRLIHDIYKNKNLHPPLVSLAKNLQSFEPYNQTLKNKLAVFLRNRLYNIEFISRLSRHNCLDFIGVNYYTRSVADAVNWGLRALLLDEHQSNASGLKKNTLGWDIYPQGFYNVLFSLKKFNKPVFIMENGICTEDDNLRWEFIAQHLKKLFMAMQAGLKVLGYTYWSLLDNYEWDKGFGPRFGLIEVDYNTFNRKVRESAVKFSSVCKTGILET